MVSKIIKLSTGDKRDLLKREEGFFSVSYTYPSFCLPKMMLDREHWLSGCFMDNAEEINVV